jgi:hypothetical protein
MATIKLQSGKVITKEGKVSCSCCGEVCNGPISGQNVFEITKQEYDAYFSGGTWDVSTTWTQFESANPNCLANGTGDGNISLVQTGCIHNVAGTADASTTYSGNCFGDTTVNYTFGFGITLELGVDTSNPRKYYAKYYAYSNVSNSSLSSSPTGYPATVNFNVDGNNLIAFGDWGPGWSSYSGYTNNSTATLTASFSPNT